MAKEEMYHIALDDYEHGIIIRSLNDEKTDLIYFFKLSPALLKAYLSDCSMKPLFAVIIIMGASDSGSLRVISLTTSHSLRCSQERAEFKDIKMTVRSHSRLDGLIFYDCI